MKLQCITLKNVSFAYETNTSVKDKEVLSDISFSVSKAESVGIIGANGVGKSTLLKLFVGLLADYRGTIYLGDILVTKDNLAEVREKTGYVFQDSDSQLFMSTVYDDVAFAPRNYGLSEDSIKERTINALRAVNIEHLKDHHIYKLSGGQKKLASIATILSMRPDLILLDEPSVGLDPRNRKNLIDVINKLNSIKIIASHDLDLIYDTCQRVVLISNGVIKADGKAEQVLTNRVLLEENGLELPLSFSR